jgi:hypothetical protein
MNKLVLNFLIVEGYKEGAKKFIKEAGIDLNNDLKGDFDEQLMDQRMQIRKFILAGKIRLAIALINEVNPTVSFVPLILYLIDFGLKFKP